jgi:dephospho-CoA kinase
MKNVTKPGLKLGVTGGIGSGKTSVCKVFRVLGVPVFSADRIASYIMDNDKDIIVKINLITGRDLYTSGSLDRMALASLIFNNNTLLDKVNKLVHPVVIDHYVRWEMDQNVDYVIMEAAILFESGASKLVDKIVTIVAPEEERLSRVTQRSKLSRYQVMERMKNQLDDETRIRLSDYVIYNSENDMIIPAILSIHEDILKNLKTVN